MRQDRTALVGSRVSAAWCAALGVARPRVRARSKCARVGIAVVLLALSAALPVAARGQVPRPDTDPFYAVPASLAAYPEGTVVRSRAIALFGLPLPVSAWQVQYRTTDAAGRPVPGIATLMVPMLPWFGLGARPLLSYQVAEDSLGTQCAPSFALRGGWDTGVVNTLTDTPFMGEALRRGWAVVASDYEGPQSRFLDGVLAGHAVLDGIRAVRALGHGAVDETSPVGAWGYSGGAFATLWAAQLQPRYAPDVRFAGMTSGGVPADWPAIARGVDGGYQAGLALLVLIAIARNNPDSGVTELLNERGRALLVENAEACGSDLVPKYLYARVDDFSAVPNLLSHPRFRAATAAQEVGGSTPVAPMYLYHSITDEVIPVAGYTDLVGRYCAQGADISYMHSRLPGHNATAVGEAPGAMGYLADRFAGLPVAQGCHER